MTLQENIQRIREMMEFLTEKEQKLYENKPIILIGPQGTGKSTTAKELTKKLGIPLITTDMCMIDKKYVNLCKEEPGVEVKIKEHPTLGTYNESNDEYVFCVLNKLMDEYGNKKIVLDVGATHAYVSDRMASDIIELFEKSPNLFIFNVSGDEDKTYEFLKKRREGRGEETKDEDDKKFRTAINNLNNYYRGTQKISIIDKDKKSKTTDELVDEIITKLT
jgi:shikimate kinase